MAANSKDIELRIRARDYSQKTLDEVVSTLKSLAKAQDEQIEGAKRGEVSSRALEDAYRKLESAGKALLSQDALIRTFDSQAKALDVVKERVNAAREAHAAFEKSLDGATERTSRQTTELNRLSRAVATAERAQLQAETRLERTSSRLAEYGINSDNASKAQDQIRSAVTLTNQALEKQDKAITRLDDDLKAHRRTQQQVAEAAREAARFEEQRAANLRRMQEGEVNNMWQGLLAQREEKERKLAAAAAERAAQQKAADEAAAAAARQSIALAHEQAIAEDKARTAAKKDEQARQAQRDALSKAADEAEALAKGYETLGRTVSNVRTDTLAKQIKSINDPAGEALKTVDGLVKAIDGIEAKANAATGPVKGYSNTLKELSAVQSNLSRIAGQVDGYQRQMEAVRGARTEYTQARRAVNELIAQMRSGQGDTSQLTAQMARAQSTLKSTADAMRQQTQRAREMRDALREAGVDTRNLAAAEDQLVKSAQRTAAATDQLTGAFNKYGAAVESADKKVKLMVGGRTTLSYFQRLRGEVLGIATAFVGVNAAVGLAKDSLDAYRSEQAIESRLGVMVGNDANLIKKEWDYIMGQSDRLGFGFEKLAMSYSKFGVAARQTGLSQDEVRFIFEGLSEAARVAKMSTDDFEGSLKAIEQMISKGSIQAEELRQQLGDRLPGAMAMAAKGAGMTIAEFSKMMEQGQIGAEFVINLARQLGTEYSERLPEAINSMAAQEGRLETAIYKFRLAIAKGGFVEAYSLFIERLTKILNSQEGQNLAQSLSTAFTKVVQALQWCAENVDTLKQAFAVFMAIQVFAWGARLIRTFATMVTAIRTLRASMVTLTGTATTTGAAVGAMAATMGASAATVGTLTRGVTLLTAALRTMVRFIPYIGAAYMAYEAYNFLTEDDAEALKQAGIEIGENAGTSVAEGVAEGIEEGFRTTLPDSAGGNPDLIAQRGIDKVLGDMQKRNEKADRRTRLKGAKAERQERLDIVAEEYEFLEKQAKAQITNEKARAETLERIEKEKNRALKIEGMRFDQDQARSAGGAGAKRISLARQVADELAKIEDDLAKRATHQDPTASFDDRMRTRIAAVTHEYDKLAQRIDQLAKTDKAASEAAKERLADFVKQRQEIERVKVTEEELSRLEKGINDQTSLRNTLLERANTLHKMGIYSYEQVRDAVAEANRQTSEEIAQLAQAYVDLAEKAKGVLRPEAYQAMRAKGEILMATNNPETFQAQAMMEEAERRTNELLEQRNAILAEIQSRRELGLISDRQMAEEMDATNARFRELALASSQEALTLATMMREEGLLSETYLDALIAKFQQLTNEIQNSQDATTKLGDTMANSMLNGVVGSIDAAAQAMANLITKQEDSSDAWANAGIAVANFFAQFLRDVAMAIIRQSILNALVSMTGGSGPIGSALVKMGGQVMHSGGIVGQGAGTRTRSVSPFVFAGAERFHSGGLPGLRSNEIPTILEKGEEVLDRENPRNILNGGAAAGGQAGSTRFVLVDDRASMAEAMAGQEGEQVTMLHLRRNVSTLKQWMR